MIKDLFCFRESTCKRIQFFHDLGSDPTSSILKPSNNTVPDFFIMIIVKLIESIEDSHSLFISIDSHLTLDDTLVKERFEVSIPKLVFELLCIRIFRFIESLDYLH